MHRKRCLTLLAPLFFGALVLPPTVASQAAAAPAPGNVAMAPSQDERGYGYNNGYYVGKLCGERRHPAPPDLKGAVLARYEANWSRGYADGRSEAKCGERGKYVNPPASVPGKPPATHGETPGHRPPAGEGTTGTEPGGTTHTPSTTSTMPHTP
ncbi:hypothetical protein ACGFOU_31290 [Streptomyces sp. NPDC048595]|uniref:hypothetical protein n=1 Tax=Streptomyces sp. NPDC048595 TaxID=3365576 RepID=UPI00371503A1